MRFFKPWIHEHRIYEIDPDQLMQGNVKAILVDLDNTLVRGHENVVDEATVLWVERIKGLDIKICIMSNNRKERIESFAKRFGVLGIWNAAKPNPLSYRKAMQVLGVPRRHCAAVGDQLFTDMVGGRLYGMRFILVDPITRKELKWTSMMRKMEHFVAGRIIPWDDE